MFLFDIFKRLEVLLQIIKLKHREGVFLGACNRIVVEINNRFRKIVMFSVVENMTIFF